MDIKPVFTEKSLKLAKEGKYTFWVPTSGDKAAIKSVVGALFGVHVVGVKTITVHGESKRNAKGKKIRVLSSKKAIVTLKEGEKLGVFEESKK